MKKKKRFFKKYKPLLNNYGMKEESGGSYLFFKKKKDGELARHKNGRAKAVWVDVEPRYTVKCPNGHEYKFDKKRNVNKVLRKLGINEPARQTSFSWSNDKSFESGNGKVTSKGYALRRTRDEGKSWGWSFPDGSFKEDRKKKKRGDK